jgi:hypothetical protein
MKKVVILKVQTNNYYFFDLETGNNIVMSKGEGGRKSKAKPQKIKEMIPWIVDNYSEEDKMEMYNREFDVIKEKIKNLSYKNIEPINGSYQKALKNMLPHLFI